MKRNYSLLGIVLPVVIGSAFCFLRTTAGQGLRICDGTGGCTFNGFAQSSGDPNTRGPAQLVITSQLNDEWTGVFTLYGTTYTATGKVDADGNVKFSSGGRRATFRGAGKLQDLARGGALLFSSYKLASGDQGQVNFLRNFTQPPDPDMPPDIAGSWGGTFKDLLSLVTGTAAWIVQQDRAPTGAPSTGFMGQETLDTIIYDFVGTIDGEGNFVRIGLSAEALLIEGGKFESGQLTAASWRDSSGPAFRRGRLTSVELTQF